MSHLFQVKNKYKGETNKNENHNYIKLKYHMFTSNVRKTTQNNNKGLHNYNRTTKPYNRILNTKPSTYIMCISMDNICKYVCVYKFLFGTKCRSHSIESFQFNTQNLLNRNSISLILQPNNKDTSI